MDFVVKNLQIVNAKYTLFSFSLWKELWKNFRREKFWTVKFSDLLSELFLRPNFFVINVYLCYDMLTWTCAITDTLGWQFYDIILPQFLARWTFSFSSSSMEKEQYIYLLTPQNYNILLRYLYYFRIPSGGKFRKNFNLFFVSKSIIANNRTCFTSAWK